jgi:hypothetical protein
MLLFDVMFDIYLMKNEEDNFNNSIKKLEDIG